MNLGLMRVGAGLGLAMFIAGAVPASAVVQRNAQACNAASNRASAIAAQNNALVFNNQGAFVLWATTGIDLAGFGAAAARLQEANDAQIAACSE